MLLGDEMRGLLVMVIITGYGKKLFVLIISWWNFPSRGQGSFGGNNTTGGYVSDIMFSCLLNNTWGRKRQLLVVMF